MIRFFKHFFVWPFVAFALLWFLGFVGFIAYSNTVRQKSFYACDGFVVFTGFFDRITPGFHVFKNHCKNDSLPKLLLSGVDEENKIENLITFSTPKERHVLLPHISLGTARNTIENAFETIVWAKQHSLHTLCLITNRYHAPRSLMELKRAQRQLLSQKETIPINVEIFPLEHSKEWWKDKDRFYFLCMEYHKYVIRMLLTHLT